MKRRYCICTAIVAVMFAMTLGVLATLPTDDRPGVTKENFDRIQKGMSREQVNAILGTNSTFRCAFATGGSAISNFTWHGVDGTKAEIVFLWHTGNVHDEVHSTTWTPSTETVLEKISRWLRFNK